ncbi:MAG: bifunctional folylpolyglutamate synthase/dihydrofolate synthase, partial [Planctomycetota bacterium]
APVEVATLEPLLDELLSVDPARPPTFFEAMTAAAVERFSQAQVDLAVYEVGLGGRLDATTAIPVDASIVTRIELEHTDVLGDTVAAIAAEKAPVIRSGGLGLTATTGDALAVVRQYAGEVGAELLVAGEDFSLRDVEHGPDGARGELCLPDGSRRAFTLPGASAFSLPALALAAATLQRVLPDLPLALDPAPTPQLPGRFEVFAEPDGEQLVLDGAHTEDSLRAVADELRRRAPGRRPVVLTAAAAGKRWREGLSALLPIADSFVVTELSGTPGEDPAEISAWLTAQGAQSEVCEDVVAGLRALRARPGPRLVVGSFYLAGAVRQLVCDPDPRQPHEQSTRP